MQFNTTYAEADSGYVGNLRLFDYEQFAGKIFRTIQSNALPPFGEKNIDVLGRYASGVGDLVLCNPECGGLSAD